MLCINAFHCFQHVEILDHGDVACSSKETPCTALSVIQMYYHSDSLTTAEVAWWR